MNINHAVNDFLVAKQANNASAETLIWYQVRLRPFTAAFGETALDQVSTGDVRRYLIALRERDTKYPGQARAREGHLSNETLRGHDRALRTFWNWAEREYDLPDRANPMRRIDRPKKQQQPPKAIALGDLEKLLSHLLKDRRAAAQRNLAMILFLADTGCRAGGMLTLTPDNLDLDNRQAILIEKGSRMRAVPFTQITADAIRRWLMLRPARAKTVFCSLAANHTGGALTLTGLHMVIRRLKKSAGLQGRCNPHSFRHGFARQYLLNGGDLATLSKILGHKDLRTTTDNYAIFTGSELAARHDEFSPIRNLKEILQTSCEVKRG